MRIAISLTLPGLMLSSPYSDQVEHLLKNSKYSVFERRALSSCPCLGEDVQATLRLCLPVTTKDAGKKEVFAFSPADNEKWRHYDWDKVIPVCALCWGKCRLSIVCAGNHNRLEGRQRTFVPCAWERSQNCCSFRFWTLWRHLHRKRATKVDYGTTSFMIENWLLKIEVVESIWEDCDQLRRRLELG